MNALPSSVWRIDDDRERTSVQRLDTPYHTSQLTDYLMTDDDSWNPVVDARNRIRPAITHHSPLSNELGSVHEESHATVKCSCGKLFRGKSKNAQSNLKRHIIQKHSQGRKSNCPECGISFTRSDNLKKHLITTHCRRPRENPS